MKSSHPNIKVIHQPKKGSKHNPYIWSRHEKIVVVHQNTDFLGGIDLANGRYDTQCNVIE